MSKRLSSLITAAAFAAAMMPLSGAIADVINTAADAHVNSSVDTVNTNFGTSANLEIKNDNGNFHRKAYMRFDLSSLGFDHATQLSAGTLNLEFVDSGRGTIKPEDPETWVFNVYGINDGAGEAWAENTITWSNAPANTATTGGNLASASSTLLGSFTVSGKGIGLHSFTSQALADFIAADTNDLVTFAIVRATQTPVSGSYAHAIASEEHTTASAPSLDLLQVPEPASLGLMGFSVLLVMNRNRSTK